MSDSDAPDTVMIRSVVDRVIDSLGPDATATDVRSTALSVLRQIHPERSLSVPDTSATLIDLPSGDRPDPRVLGNALGRAGDASLFVRTTADVVDRPAAKALMPFTAALAAYAEALGTRSPLFGLTVAPDRDGAALEVVAELLSSRSELRVSIVCARPGLGLNERHLDRVLRIQADLATTEAARLSVACRRIPVSRAGVPRVEIASAVDPDTWQIPPSEVDSALGELVGAGLEPAFVRRVLAVPADAPAEAWRRLRAARPFASGFAGLRVEGWPVTGVPPFGVTPLLPDGDAASHLRALVAAGSVAPVFIGRSPNPA